MGTGQAAGLAASLAVKEGTDPRKIPGTLIRKLMIDEGVPLDKPTDGYWQELREKEGEYVINAGDAISIAPAK